MLSLGPSFGTIAAFGPNAALPHYEPTVETNRVIDDTSVFMLDSGGQYLGTAFTKCLVTLSREMLHPLCFSSSTHRLCKGKIHKCGDISGCLEWASMSLNPFWESLVGIMTVLWSR